MERVKRMKWKEKVDETAEKIYDLVKSGKYDVEVGLPKNAKKQSKSSQNVQPIIRKNG